MNELLLHDTSSHRSKPASITGWWVEHVFEPTLRIDIVFGMI